MAFIPTDSVVQSSLFYEGSGGAFAQNRFYFGASDPPVMTDLEEIDEALYNAFVANVLPDMSGFWQLNGITHRAMNEEEGLYLISPQDYPAQGGLGDAEMEAAQVSYTVTLNTGLIGRSARGRIYGVGLGNSFANGTRLTPTAQTDLQTNWNAVKSAMELAGHAFQVVSFFEGGVARTEGRPLPVLSMSVRFPLATQRRRLS